MIYRLFQLLLILSMALLAASGLAQGDARGAILTKQFVQSFSPSEIDYLSSRLYARVESYPRARYGVDLYIISYASTNGDDSPAELLAQLYIPRINELRSVPVYVMGSGTTGIAPHCATSRELPAVRSWGNYRAHMLSYAAQGYIAIIPDYHGFHEPSSPHDYFVADLEARAILDAARAVYSAFRHSPLLIEPAQAVFLAGFSQGGHAVFAATDAAPAYAPELNIRGAIGYAPATSVEALMRDTPYLTPYILYAYAHRYGSEVANPARKLNPRWLATFERDVMGKCIDEIDSHYGRDPQAVYRPEFYNALYGGRLAESYPELKAVLDMNATGLARSDVPALVIQGGADPIVSTPAQDQFVRRHCALGADLTYHVYEGVNHFQARQAGVFDALAWMESIMSGESLPSDCARILAETP
jgi:pimeloyl-ACP methyl ester carboxylesterase